MANTTHEKGFTLIELIVTISILAVLITILVVAINPAEQLARARDARRVADLEAMKSGLNLYLATATGTINLTGDSTASDRCKSGTTPTVFVNSSGAVSTTSISSNYNSRSASTSQAIGATGWLPARLDLTPGGSPIEKLPLDPTNGTGSSVANYYYYICDKTSSNQNKFELGAPLESTYFLTDLDLDGTDGGSSSTLYEAGNDSGLDL